MQAALLELVAAAAGARAVPANLHGMLNRELSDGIIEDSVVGKAVHVERVAEKVKAWPRCGPIGPQPNFNLRVPDVTQDAQVDRRGLIGCG